MPSGPPVCQLAASVRPTGDIDFSGWPTASSRDHKGGYQGGRMRNGAISTDTLDVAAQLTAWPTPTETDSASSARHGYMKLGHDGTTLFDAARLAAWRSPKATETMGRYSRVDGKDYPSLWGQAQLAAWPTPIAGNADGSQMGKEASSTGRRPDGTKATVALPSVARLASWPTPLAHDTNRRGNTNADHHHFPHDLPNMAELAGLGRLTASGEILTGSSAETKNGGQLNPAFSLWLMGLPSHWVLAAPLKASRARKSSARQGIASSRKSRRNSSRPT